MQKTLLVVGLALLTSVGLYLNQGPMGVQEEFQTWKSVNGRKYGGVEETVRFQIFSENHAIVMMHNARFAAGLESFELGLNSFADLTNEEFTAMYLGAAPKASRQTISVSDASVSYPTEVNWVESLKIVVKNQGSCGSCWAFSAVGALEGVHSQNGHQVYLSEQELVDCANSTEGYESDGCNGGWMNDGFDYSVKHGVAVEGEYSYKGVDGKCGRDNTKTRYSTTGLVDVERLSSDALHNAIAKQPVAVAINAGGIYFQLYKKGIFKAACKGGEVDLNHGVLAVGYAEGYYLVKNSWGSGWGDQGYIKMATLATPEGQCGIQQLPSYPVHA